MKPKFEFRQRGTGLIFGVRYTYPAFEEETGLDGFEEGSVFIGGPARFKDDMFDLARHFAVAEKTDHKYRNRSGRLNVQHRIQVLEDGSKFKCEVKNVSMLKWHLVMKRIKEYGLSVRRVTSFRRLMG